jgi:hypothetical protein
MPEYTVKSGNFSIPSAATDDAAALASRADAAASAFTADAAVLTADAASAPGASLFPLCLARLRKRVSPLTVTGDCQRADR